MVRMVRNFVGQQVVSNFPASTCVRPRGRWPAIMVNGAPAGPQVKFVLETRFSDSCIKEGGGISYLGLASADGLSLKLWERRRGKALQMGPLMKQRKQRRRFPTVISGLPSQKRNVLRTLAIADSFLQTRAGERRGKCKVE